MPDEVLGIPLHPLVVHATVVIVPLTAVATVAIAVWRRWRDRYGWLVVVASAVSLILVPVTTRSGKRLFETLQLGGPALDKVQQHQAMGGRVIYAVAPLFVLNLLLMLAERNGRPSREVNAVAVLAALAAVAAAVLVILTGHLGATAVWNPTG